MKRSNIIKVVIANEGTGHVCGVKQSPNKKTFNFTPIHPDKGGFVYIMTNTHNNVLYIGVTNDLKRRVYEHKNRMIPGSFTSKYNCTKLVYYSIFPFITAAIEEEKRLKSGNRKKKLL